MEGLISTKTEPVIGKTIEDALVGTTCNASDTRPGIDTLPGWNGVMGSPVG